MNIDLKYKINSQGVRCEKRTVLSEEERKERMYDLCAKSGVLGSAAVDFVFSKDANFHEDWLVFPCSVSISASSDEVQHLINRTYTEKEEDYCHSLYYDKVHQQWYMEGVFLMRYERNLADDEYIRMGSISDEIFPISAFAGFLKDHGLTLTTSGERNYETDSLAVFHSYSEPAQPNEPIAPAFQIYKTFMDSLAKKPEIMPYTNEMMVWSYYRFGTQSIYPVLYKAFENTQDWLRDRNLPFRARFDKLRGTITLSGSLHGTPTEGTFFIRTDRNGDVVAITNSGAVYYGEEIWDGLEDAIHKRHLFDNRIAWFSKDADREQFFAEAKEAYRQQPPKKLLRRKIEPQNTTKERD